MKNHLNVLYFLFLGLWIVSCQPSQQNGANIDPLATKASLIVEDFGLHDHKGGFHQLYYYQSAPAIVLFVHGNACPIVRQSMPALEEVRDQFEAKGVKFFLLNANPQDKRDDISEEAKEYKIDFPILDDESQVVAEALNITRTAEAIVLNPKDWTIAYRGPVDDRLNYESQKSKAENHYLSEALKAVLKGKAVKETNIKTPGCLVSLSNLKADTSNPPTYTKDIAPILQNICQNCHRPKGIGPWAMMNYEVVKGWAPMIREVVRTKRMPPWQADPHIGTFSNDISLSPDQIRKIVHWVEAGAPRGEGEDPLLAQAVEPAGWAMGEPDLILELAPQEIPATGVIDYIYIEKKVALEEGKWVKAVQFEPGNRAVLHHALVSIDYPEGYKPPLETDQRWLNGLFATYAPGTEAEIFPEGAGRFLPKGSTLIFQMHYTPIGKEELDQSKLGIYFTDEKIEKEYIVVGPFNAEFKIPPHDAAYAVSATQRFDEDVTLYSMFPHMHFRGKSMSYTAIYPDGKEELILSVPRYDFNWQRGYNLEKPLKLPAGSAIRCDAQFDNSAANKYNPAPEEAVYWGEQSFEEMMIGYMSYVRGLSEEHSEASQQLASRNK